MSVKTEESKEDEFKHNLQGKLGYLLVLPTIFLFIRMTFKMIKEKEMKIKQVN